MPKQKPITQYGTLDVLLMMLLYNAKRAVRLPAEIFKKHSLFFAKHRTVSVSVRWPDKDHIHTDTVMLRCTDKDKLRRLIEKYLSSYRKNKISSTEIIRGCEKTDAELARFVFLQSCKRRHITFEFTSTDKYGSPSMASVYSLDTASFVMAFSWNGFPVVEILPPATPTGKLRVTIEVDASALWDNVRTHNVTGWRVRLDSPCASYKGHQIKFDKSSDKQKRLLDMLVSSKNGEVDTDKVISELDVDDTNRDAEEDKEFARERIRKWGREIRKKVNKQCKKDGYGQADFRVEVGKNKTKLVDTSPV